MAGLRNLSIQSKLTVITMVSSGLALLLAGIFALGLNWQSHTEATKARLQALATVIGDRSQAALLFDDESLLTDNLSTLKFEPSVDLACLYIESGTLAASYRRDPESKGECEPFDSAEGVSAPQRWFLTQLDVLHPILMDDAEIGRLWLYSDLGGVRELIKRDAVVIMMIILGVSLIALVLATRMQRLITSPIRKLNDAARSISEDFDLTVSVVREGNDELGTLVDAFNEMVSTIREQNISLSNAKNSYFALYHDNPMMLFTLKQNGIVVAVNEHGASQMGVDRSSLIGRGFTGLIYPEDRQVMVDMIQGCLLDDKNVHHCEVRHMHPEQSGRWMRITARVIRTSRDEINILLVCEDITEQRRLSERLTYQASHDSLTGLVNRSEFERRIASSLELLITEQDENVLLYMDLDQFKVINDTCGHVAGDQMLRNLAGVLTPVIRHRDTLARLGGDEFGVLLEGCSLEQAREISQHIIQAINEYEFYWEGKRFVIGISIGAVSYCNSSQSVTELMRMADAACYMAKDKGRNRIHVYETDDMELAVRHGEMSWVNRIQAALSEDRLCLMHQPIQRIGQGGVAGGSHGEILVRMMDEEGELVMPGSFLPAAERYNLSPQVDRWVVSHTLKWFSAHPERMDRNSVCSINLSGNSLTDEDFFGFLIKAFKDAGVSPANFCFEITETAAIANLDVAVNFITECRRRFGCRFSLDDFGAGFSSFAYLKNLPVDYLKIDGQFVRDMLGNPVNLAMVKSINEIGKVMGKLTVAEFVESREVLDELREIGIDYAQGFYIGKPQRLSL
ncbi:MAG: bifunctional diguanylate cyclase/phosphodiesterase [bacterium]